MLGADYHLVLDQPINQFNLVLLGEPTAVFIVGELVCCDTRDTGKQEKETALPNNCSTIPTISFQADLGPILHRKAFQRALLRND